MMQAQSLGTKRSFFSIATSFFWIILGAILAGCAIELIFIPHQLIDGGIVGLSQIFSKIFGEALLPYFLVLFNLPFLYLAYKNIGKSLVVQMFLAVICFAATLIYMHGSNLRLEGLETLEVIIIGGVTLGTGLGMIIRKGGCLDGTEILGLMISQQRGYTVGQVVFVFNIFVFSLAGIVYGDWHPAFQSLMTFFVAMKVMDLVIVGLDETKAVHIISPKTKEISQALMHELGLGVTILYARGAYSNKSQEVIYVVVERLQLYELKELTYREDPTAFVAIENLHEVVNGKFNT